MNTTTSQAHIITHTHWDREWFLTSVYTSQWIPGLIDKIEELVAINPSFQFLFDGQTLVIEDLINIAPQYRERAQKLIEQNNLIIGPYYCQPDWQLTYGEALIRNLQYGLEDVKRFGGEPEKTGWLVDTFGHISQSPQIHHLFDINSVFVWRGMPEMIPYFQWEASNGDSIFTINLFGGYRNLYGITHAPEIAIRRLAVEVEKLSPYYPTPEIPLFDGYDLEDSPEDPVSFYAQNASEVPSDIGFHASTPQKFAETIQQSLDTLPLIKGELNSGKYGATFPGTFSARAYLKIMAWDCSHLLYQVCEPLATLAYIKGRSYESSQYEHWSRALLQNAVHDCICGVSIDQVHEKMAYTYQQLFTDAQTDIAESLNYIMRDFSTGTYAISTNPFVNEMWCFSEDIGYFVQPQGVGVWQVTETCAVENPNTSIETFQWINNHYTALLSTDGILQIDEATIGRLSIYREQGDTYSDERGELLGDCQITAMPIIEQQSELHRVVYYPCSFAVDNITITAQVRLYFDQSPLLRWTIDLDSHGTNFSVDMVFETNQKGTVFAGMPFDVVQRPTSDANLLARDVDPKLSKILLGQREVGEVRTFPFHDFVAISDNATTAIVLAKGVYAYQADDNGKIVVTLRRSVEWLTKANLENRVGDAGPFFYVPDARCERQVRHELAFAIGDFDSLTQQQLNANYQNPPIIVNTQSQGEQSNWAVFQENLPLANLQVDEGQILARVSNSTDTPIQLHQTYDATDVWGQSIGTVETIEPHMIKTLSIEHSINDSMPRASEQASQLVANLHWRVEENHGMPDLAVIDQLNTLVADLEIKISKLDAELETIEKHQTYRTEHKLYMYKREFYEYQLSIRLNEMKLADNNKLASKYLFELDAKVAEIGFELNKMRIKRRIYDYIVESI